MRIIYSDEIRCLQEKVRSYLVLDKESMRLVVPDNAPDEIKEMYKISCKLIAKETEEAQNYLMNLKVELKA